MLCKHFSKLFQESNCYRVPLKKRYKLKSRSFTTLGLRHGFFYENLQQKTVNSYFCTVIPLIKLLFFIETKFSATFFPIKFFFTDTEDSHDSRGKRVGDFYFPQKIQTVFSEAVGQRCSIKKLFLEISQNPQENTCARVSFLIKLQDSGLQLY